MTLNSEGLEKAVAAYNTRQDPTHYATTVQDYGVQEKARQHVQMSAAISAYLSALPPVDGMEVVAWLTPYFENTRSGQLVPQVISREAAQKGRNDWEGLVTLSQASSVIAGLTAERDAAQASAFVRENRFVLMDGAYNREFSRAQAAEARISSLEEENKRLREALAPFAEVAEKDIGDSEHENDLFQPMQQNNRAPRLTVGHLKAARQALEVHNG